MDGKSLIPILLGDRREGHDVLYWEHEGNRAVLKDNFKLVSYFSENRQEKVSRGERTGKWELYNLINDRTELYDLAEDHPEIVKELESLYSEWSANVGVVPWEELQDINTKLIQKANKN